MSVIDPAIAQAVIALTEAAAEGQLDGTHRPGRFLTVTQVAEELAVSPSTVSNLIRRGRLQAVKVDSRQWRIERVKLEEFIARAYAEPAGDGTA